MKAARTLIAWEAETVAGCVAVGPLVAHGVPDWTRSYRCTGGAAYVWERNVTGLDQQLAVIRNWYLLVYSYGVHPYTAHRAFLMIDEYVKLIKEWGCGPDKGERGHDREVPYGRCVCYPTPEIKVHQLGESWHFIPRAEEWN